MYLSHEHKTTSASGGGGRSTGAARHGGSTGAALGQLWRSAGGALQRGQEVHDPLEPRAASLPTLTSGTSQLAMTSHALRAHAAHLNDERAFDVDVVREEGAHAFDVDVAREEGARDIDAPFDAGAATWALVWKVALAVARVRRLWSWQQPPLLLALL
jgi:hypothetical protein